MQLQTISPAVRWQPLLLPMPPEAAEKPQTLPQIDPSLWSSLSDIIELLRFDGKILEAADERPYSRRPVQAGETVLRMGQAFDGMYVVRLGALKTCISHVGGSEHVLAFPMKGDLLGYDGAFKNQYLSEVVALTDCELIKIPVLDFFVPGKGCNDIERLAYWAISREIAQEQSYYALLHSARTDARVARFLMIQSQRFADMGYSPTRFNLPMTRRDIGNHLGATLETVSRAFSTMNHLGLISIKRREVHIHSLNALRAFSE
jgi:CRP/FNR family transcriptional regulator